MGITTREWTAVYDGHAIRVTNAWFSGAKLYVDGDCRDTNNEALSVSVSRPLLSCSIGRSDAERALVEVYLVSIVRTFAMICVNGERVAGDLVATPPKPAPVALETAYRSTSTSHAAREVSTLQRSLVNARTMVAALFAALLLVSGVALIAALR